MSIHEYIPREEGLEVYEGDDQHEHNHLMEEHLVGSPQKPHEQPPHIGGAHDLVQGVGQAGHRKLHRIPVTM